MRRSPVTSAGIPTCTAPADQRNVFSVPKSFYYWYAPGVGPSASGGSADEAMTNLESQASRMDAFPGKPRVFVLSDIGNEPDDQMSLTRLLLYSNDYDIEGLVAVTSTW